MGPKRGRWQGPARMVLTRIPPGDKGGSQETYYMAKTSEVLQKPEESPANFYERLCEAFRVYTPFDPEAPKNQQSMPHLWDKHRLTSSGNFKN